MALASLTAAQRRRLARSIAWEVRLWLHTVIAGAAAAFVLWTVAQLALGWVAPGLARAVAEATTIAVAWALGGSLALLAVFAARGLAVGLAETFLQAEERSRAVTLIGLAAAVAVMALALLVAGPVRADATAGSSDYCARDLGAWFYCARPTPPSPATGKEGPRVEKPTEVIELEAFQREVEEARQIAVWKPTPQNVRRYYLLQQTALERGGLFADQWRRMVWTSPELDYTLRRPVSEIGKRTWEDERLFDRELFLKAAGPELGLFYVFRESCAACRIFSPVVKAFSGRYAVSVRAISADGGRNADFPAAVVDRGQLKAWGFAAPATPALLIFQKQSARPVSVKVSNGKTVRLRRCARPRGCLTYLGAGVMSVEDIAERMFVLLATEPGQDF